MKELFLALIITYIVCGCNTEHVKQTDKASVIEATYITEEFTSRCPDDMVEVNGEFCPNVEEMCLRWVDRKGGNTVDIHVGKSTATDYAISARCGEFKSPTRCLSKQTVHKHYCIDVFEYPNVSGELPRSWMNWYDVKKACESEGKRLCTRTEWAFACEGPEMHPYPYGDGYHRDNTSCNTDNSFPPGLDVFRATRHDSVTGIQLDQMLVPSGLMENCVSPFGVHDMVGNIDELVVNESGHPYKSDLVGGHIFGVRNNCRAVTDGHNELFSWYETGGRCCRDVE